jgi:hypothetical protein
VGGSARGWRRRPYGPGPAGRHGRGARGGACGGPSALLAAGPHWRPARMGSPAAGLERGILRGSSQRSGSRPVPDRSRNTGRKLSPPVSVRERAAKRAAQRDSTRLRVALDQANTGRIPGVPGSLRAARAWVHQAVHESNRAVSPSDRLSGHHSNNAACVGRTLWSRERDRESVDRIAGVTGQRSWLGRIGSRSLGEGVQDVDRPPHIQAFSEPTRTPCPRVDTQAL